MEKEYDKQLSGSSSANNQAEASTQLATLHPPILQFKSTESEKEEGKINNFTTSRKFAAPPNGTENKATQLKSAGENGTNEAPPFQLKANSTGLPDQLKSGVEHLSGFSLNDVNVHYNSSKPAQLQAHAYAQGSDIHLGPGQERHLPHEAWHVVQQKQGRVKPTLQMKGSVNINDDDGLEREADVMGAKAVQSTNILVAVKNNSGQRTSSTVQRQIIKGGASKVKLILSKNDEWNTFTSNKSKKAQKYLAALDEMLDTIHNTWSRPFTPEEIAEVLRTSDYTVNGVKSAKQNLVSEIEEEIDLEVLDGGHSGEKHYGKDEEYQRERIEAEGKARVTTIEDTKLSKKLFTAIKLAIKDDLLAASAEIINEISELDQISVGKVKGATGPYVGEEIDFTDYNITFESIGVKGAGGNSVNIKLQPKLETLLSVSKTEYNSDGSTEETFSPIVMYWGRNSPVINITRDDLGDYSAIWDKFEAAVKGPITAF